MTRFCWSLLKINLALAIVVIVALREVYRYLSEFEGASWWQ